MSRSVSVASRSAGIIAAMALMVMFGPARSAHAMGCHMPDRPTLGLPTQAGGLEEFGSFITLDSPGDAGLSAHNDVHVVPRPCTGEVPSPTTQLVASQGQGLTALVHWADDSIRYESLTADGVPAWLQIFAYRLDRPPR